MSWGERARLGGKESLGSRTLSVQSSAGLESLLRVKLWATRGFLGSGAAGLQPDSKSVPRTTEVAGAETFGCSGSSSPGDAPMAPPLEGGVAPTQREQGQALNLPSGEGGAEPTLRPGLGPPHPRGTEVSAPLSTSPGSPGLRAKPRPTRRPAL